MNSVVHFEMAALDMGRAKEFYKNAFGWQSFDFDGQNTMVSTTETSEEGMPLQPGAINGSLYSQPEAKAPTIVIGVPDIKAHIDIVKQHGGELVDDVVQIAEMGLYARFRDTEGNVVGLWQNLG